MTNKFRRILSAIIILFSLTGLAASFILTVERFDNLKNSGQALSCDVSSIISCSTVMKTPQAELLGFPNSLFGIVGYTATLMIGLFYYLGLIPGKKMNLGVLAGAAGAFVFSYWLLYQSVFTIGALCPYCIVSCISATNLFFGLVIFNIKNKTVGLPEKIQSVADRFIEKQYFYYVLGLWYFIFFGLILFEFKDSFS